MEASPLSFAGNAREAWLRISPRERWLVALGTVLVVGVVGHAFVWEPVMRDLAATRTALIEKSARMDAASPCSGSNVPRQKEPRNSRSRMRAGTTFS